MNPSRRSPPPRGLSTSDMEAQDWPLPIALQLRDLGAGRHGRNGRISEVSPPQSDFLLMLIAGRPKKWETFLGSPAQDQAGTDLLQALSCGDLFTQCPSAHLLKPRMSRLRCLRDASRRKSLGGEMMGWMLLKYWVSKIQTGHQSGH